MCDESCNCASKQKPNCPHQQCPQGPPPQCPQYPQYPQYPPQQPTCRPRPSLWSKINCVPCNRLFFFVVGGAVGLYYDQLKEQAEKARDAASKDNNNQKGKDKKKK
ncbi:uncharacterized protein LOC124460130 [Drosophila willistoni]|uniref:uncharacterized protein LOC124460130 n=1 Tax=Drosophila willistoni TaxID=7260 RepID=UPI00017D83F8|nr:uncharacterized protein LOC124460130 [Drosophila willistoni]